jgi:hypothetical protein
MTGSPALSLATLLARPLVGRLSLVELSALAVIGVFLALIGAFDSDQIGFGRRLAYWVFVLVAGGACGGLIEPWLDRTPVLAGRPWGRATALTLAMALPATLIVAATQVVIYGSPFQPRWLVVLYPQVALVCAALVAIAWLARREVERRAPALEGVAPPVLRERLPPRQARARLLAVQAEDHYLRIHTEAGDTLTLMRFADALDALAALDGLRVHRSWWVARGAVEEARWSRGRGDLLLAGGLEVPVSRAYAAQVRAVDWA